MYIPSSRLVSMSILSLERPICLVPQASASHGSIYAVLALSMRTREASRRHRRMADTRGMARTIRARTHHVAKCVLHRIYDSSVRMAACLHAHVMA